jgi:hypothetical protein
VAPFRCDDTQITAMVPSKELSDALIEGLKKKKD